MHDLNLIFPRERTFVFMKSYRSFVTYLEWKNRKELFEIVDKEMRGSFRIGEERE